MIGACLEFLFGSYHRNQTRPFMLNNTCYKVCLDYGRELLYSRGGDAPAEPRGIYEQPSSHR